MEGTNLNETFLNIIWLANPHHLTTVVFYPVGIPKGIPDENSKTNNRNKYCGDR